MLPERIKECRKAIGLTQQELAESLDLSQQTIAFWETGRRKPDIDTLSRMADFFHVTTDYLLGRNETGNSKDDEIVPITVAAHTSSPLTSEEEERVQELAKLVFDKYFKGK